MTQPAQPVDSAQQVQDALAAAQNPPAQTDPTPQQPVEQQPPAQQVTPQESQAPYAGYLAELPESVRPLVEPAFKKWDGDVTRRFQELHSEYDPWKAVLELGDPDLVQAQLQIAQVLEEDPQRFIKAFADAYPELLQEALGQPQTPNQQPTQGQNPEQGLGDLDPSDPLVQRINQLEQMLSQVAGGFNNFTEGQQQQENQRILDQTLAELHTKHGDFDDTYVLSQMAFRNLTPDKAVEEFKNNVLAKYGQPQQPQQPQQPNAPQIIPPGGGLPANPVNMADLAVDDKATKALVAQILDAAHSQG